MHVSARAVDGKATAAALQAVAEAFDVPGNAVTLVTGGTSRDKVVEVAGDAAAISAAYDALRRLR